MARMGISIHKNTSNTVCWKNVGSVWPTLGNGGNGNGRVGKYLGNGRRRNLSNLEHMRAENCWTTVGNLLANCYLANGTASRHGLRWANV